MPSLTELLHDATTTLQKAKVDNPRLSAEVLAAHALGLERSTLLTHLLTQKDIELTSEVVRHFKSLIAKRAKGMPVAYLTGHKEFYGRDFFVTPDTLIPRPETELLIDTALIYAQQYEQKTLYFADLGTGSGCIGLTLALELPHSVGVLIEKHFPTLLVAQKNQEALHCQNVTLTNGDFTTPCLQAQSLDLLVANPPYISQEEYTQLSREVLNFEPKNALVPALLPGSPLVDGFEHIVAIITLAANSLRTGGLLLIEIGMSQKQQALAALDDSAWQDAQVIDDLAGLPRLIYALRSK